MIEIAKKGQGQTARNRRGAHHQPVGIAALLLEGLALLHAKAVLLVHHHQAQVMELHGLLEKRVGAHNVLRIPTGDAENGFAFFGGLHGPQKQLQAVGLISQKPSEIQRVLARQDLGRRQDRALAAGLRHHRHGQEGHERFATAHVALQQAMHDAARS